MASRLDLDSAFVAWTAPGSDVESHLLDAAPGATAALGHGDATGADGRYLWLWAAAGGDYVPALLDSAEGTVRTTPALVAPGGADAPSRHGTPYVDPETGTAHAAVGGALRRRGPDPGAAVETIGGLDADVTCLSARPTRSADGGRLSVDYALDGRWHAGAMELETGRVDVWQSFDAPHGHAQFSPSDPDLLLVTRRPWIGDPGRDDLARNGLWLAREGLGMRPLSIVPEGRYARAWWGGDGAGLWIADAAEGVRYVRLQTGERTDVWPVATGRADATGDDRLVAAHLPDEDGGRIAVRDRSADATATVATGLPAPADADAGPPAPAPAFVAGDRYLAYTARVDGEPRLALAPTDALRREVRYGGSR